MIFMGSNASGTKEEWEVPLFYGDFTKISGTPDIKVQNNQFQIVWCVVVIAVGQTEVVFPENIIVGNTADFYRRSSVFHRGFYMPVSDLMDMMDIPEYAA